MSTTSIIPPSVARPPNHVSYERHSSNIQPLPPPFTDHPPKLRSDTASSHSSPESHPVDLQSPIPEELEDETSSEAANEPVTPTDNHHPHTFRDSMAGPIKPSQITTHSFVATKPQPRLVVNTASAPPVMAKKTISPSRDQPPKTPVAKRPGSSSKESHIKRGLSGFFRRSNSHGANQHDVVPLAMVENSCVGNGSETMLEKPLNRMSLRRMSANNSPYTTPSNTPPSPGSPGSPVDGNSDAKPQAPQIKVQEPNQDEFFNNRKKNRSSTGFGSAIRGKLASKLHPHSKDPSYPGHSHRHRSTSVDLDTSEQEAYAPCNSNAQLPERAVWALPAETGIGLKSRRLSLSLPDDFTVDVAELYDEFQDQSKFLGKRGKAIGKGATSNVHLMYRKGYSNEVFAVKEFRGKSRQEKEEDYTQKVKSEYSIAKSVHHPNIVETFRLCTFNGKWNHVMEYCDQGDLFHLVSQKYLSRPDRMTDRLCLFKQLVQGIHYLHSNGIAHRDIKLENILVTKDSKIKITDFGVSEVFAGVHPGLRSAGGQCGKDMGQVRLCAPGMCGSPPYVAPEVLEKNGEYDPRPLDAWGAAVVMLCMCANGCLWSEAKSGSSPLYDDLIRGWAKWNAKHADGNAPGITETDYPHVAFFDQHINPPALRRILLTMLNPDPSKRASMATIAKNRWLKNVECCQIDSYDDPGPATMIDASRLRSCSSKNITKVVCHNHLPAHQTFGHKLVRLPGSTDM
ncbi:kinase-like domain-containing protein [Amylocarpus encephaloides]|uniref:Kinase-like domain-containing protein n=1 Tax=Amylocarpus encephaloides TaxID=45428 RepID=A0A9P7Y7J2_9HELO|nr:kinase-like domain-containing protein [Amylocarpus encephaloides]